MMFVSRLLHSSFNMFFFQYDCFGEQVNREFVWEGMNSSHVCADSLMWLSLELTPAAWISSKRIFLLLSALIWFPVESTEEPEGILCPCSTCGLCFLLWALTDVGWAAWCLSCSVFAPQLRKPRVSYCSLGQCFWDVSTCPRPLWIAFTSARWQNFLSLQASFEYKWTIQRLQAPVRYIVPFQRLFSSDVFSYFKPQCVVLAAQAIRMQPIIASCYCGEKLPTLARDLREKKQGERTGKNPI